MSKEDTIIFLQKWDSGSLQMHACC